MVARSQRQPRPGRRPGNGLLRQVHRAPVTGGRFPGAAQPWRLPGHRRRKHRRGAGGHAQSRHRDFRRHRRPGIDWMIIESLLDTDIYKYSMMQAVLHQFPGAEVEYRFRCRTPDLDLRPLRRELEREIEHLCTLTLDPDELDFLASQRYFKPDFIEFLRLFRLQSRFIEVAEDDDRLA